MFRQIQPPGYSQLRDAQNPAAIAYATHMLALHGIQVPHGADPTALWRVYSAKLAGQRASASQAAAGESPDMGVTPGSIPLSPVMPGPSHPLDSGPPIHGMPLPVEKTPGVVPMGASGGGAPSAPARIANLMQMLLAARLGAGRNGVPGAE